MGDLFVFQDIETFRAIAAGVQSFAIATAVVIGGLWTVYVFWLQCRPAVGIDIRARQLTIPAESRPHVLVSVTITNKGARASRIVWGREPITLARVAVPVQGSTLLEFVTRASIAFISDAGDQKVERSTGIRPGDSKQYEVVVSVDTPGLYQATFMAEAAREHISARRRAIGPIEWKAMSYVVIE